ncbi:SAM-dependent methyltransferase [Flectobacillus roseus]|uniref:SAM-dependent methyltransferase n=1 Tax=Flectobacillus roseus TaxID=502259 RepID=A0ABT6Y6B5_9BACT|nr:SAM-dependent methyltransferase [Flectobacillus roseus]MDI9859099.1 SAM-dependent methyltransferase [Flectobacillus roseus]MDI9868206.1 SAM-dependent methyltransferase [Flectobacillus roseus]
MKTLYLIPTTMAPNTAHQVLAPQILEVVKHTNYYFVENIRTARRCISELKLGKIIDELVFFELDKDTTVDKVRSYFKQIPADASIGVMSEAGCPGVADPGAVAVQIAHEMGIRVCPLVGPSSILLGLMASGFSGQSFIFHGYLPIDKIERQKSLKNLEKSAQKLQTQIFMETPFRNNQFLEDILQTCQGNIKLCIASNVSAEDEFIQTKTISEWKKQKPDLHKKPTMFLMSA